MRSRQLSLFDDTRLRLNGAIELSLASLSAYSDRYLAQLLYDQDKVYEGGRKGGNVRDYRYNFALQAVQELLQFALVAGHSDVESVDSVFHLFFLLLNDLRQGYGEACACA